MVDFYIINVCSYVVKWYLLYFAYQLASYISTEKSIAIQLQMITKEQKCLCASKSQMQSVVRKNNYTCILWVAI